MLCFQTAQSKHMPMTWSILTNIFNVGSEGFKKHIQLSAESMNQINLLHNTCTQRNINTLTQYGGKHAVWPGAAPLWITLSTSTITHVRACLSMPHSKVPLPLGWFGTPSKWFHRPSLGSTSHMAAPLGQPVLQGLRSWPTDTHTQTDQATVSVAIGNAMWHNNNTTVPGTCIPIRCCCCQNGRGNRAADQVRRHWSAATCRYSPCDRISSCYLWRLWTPGSHTCTVSFTAPSLTVQRRAALNIRFVFA